MLLPDYAAIVALEKRSRDRSYEPYANTSGPNTGVETQPHWEWGGDQHEVGCVGWDTRDDDQAGQMGRWTPSAEDFKSSPVRPPNPRPVEDDVILRHGSDEVVDSVMSAVPENTNIRNTITRKHKGKELLPTPIKVRERHMDTPSRSHLNPFFDNPNYRWKGEADTPALIDYIEKKLGVTVRPQNYSCFIRINESNQNLDKSGMNIGNPLTPGGNRPQFVRESSTSEGEISQALSTAPQKRQNDVQNSVIPSKRRRGRRSLALPHGKPESPSSPNAIPTATPTDLDLDLVETLFSPIEYEGNQGSICIYKCPRTGEICRGFIRGRDRRNRRRHLAIHALAEKQLVESGVIGMEDALTFTRLPKVVVKCKIQGCKYETKVWRTDDVRERHEKEVHPEQYAQRMRKKNAKSGGGD